MEEACEELKAVIIRDLKKKYVESAAFNRFVTWWDTQEQQYKLKVCSEKVVLSFYIDHFRVCVLIHFLSPQTTDMNEGQTYWPLRALSVDL